MLERNDFEQQISSLARRVDPDAFRHPDDRVWSARRRAASKTASEHMSFLYSLVAVGALLLTCTATVLVYMTSGG
jgi:hypothetical protein